MILPGHEHEPTSHQTMTDYISIPHNLLREQVLSYINHHYLSLDLHLKQVAA